MEQNDNMQPMENTSNDNMKTSASSQKRNMLIILLGIAIILAIATIFCLPTVNAMNIAQKHSNINLWNYGTPLQTDIKKTDGGDEAYIKLKTSPDKIEALQNAENDILGQPFNANSIPGFQQHPIRTDLDGKTVDSAYEKLSTDDNGVTQTIFVITAHDDDTQYIYYLEA